MSQFCEHALQFFLNKKLFQMRKERAMKIKLNSSTHVFNPGQHTSDRLKFHYFIN